MSPAVSGFTEQLETNPFFKNGGIFVTIAINIVLLVIVMSIYLCCVRFCTIFNVRKKKKLIAECLKREDELFAEQHEQASRSASSGNNHQQENEEIREEETNIDSQHPSQDSTKKKSDEKADQKYVEDNSSFFEVKDLRRKYLSKPGLASWYLRGVFFWRITKSLIQVPFLIIYRTVFNGRHKSWFETSIKEEKRVIRNYGRDVLTYIRFHQLLWWVFAIMLVLFSVLLYPIHITNQGNLDAAQKEKFSKNVTGLKVGSSDQFLVVSSINTVIGRPDILILHVILSVITVVLVLSMILLFTRDTSLREYDYCGCDQEGIYGSFSPYLPRYFGAEFPLKTQNMALGTPHENLNYKSLSPFTLEIHNIPKNYTNKTLFHQLMQKIFSRNATDLTAPTNPHIISSYHIINYSKREKLQQEFETQLDNLERYNWQLAKKNKRPKKLCFFLKEDDDSKRKLIQRKDALTFTKDKIRKLHSDIESLEEELILSSNYPNRISSSIQGSGIGYVVFSSRHSLVQSLKSYTKMGTFKVYQMIETDQNGQEILKLFTTAERRQLPIDAKVKAIRLRATNTGHEPRDCYWTTLYSMYQQSWLKPILLKIAIFLLILIIFVFFTTPIVVVSSIDTFFAIPAVTDTIKKIVEVGGPMMSVLFQYIPSLLLVVSSALIPVFIYQLTKLEDIKTFSEFSRTILRRITIFLWLNTFILPTLVLTTLDGVTNFFTNPDSWGNIFKNLFMSDNGSLFINYILNKTLYGLAFTLMPLLSLILYSVFTLCTSSVSKKCRINRAMRPKDKLRWAEGDAFSLEYSYAYSFTIMAIVFTFSLFSPFILLVAFIYFTLRYYVERFTIGRMYSHRLVQHHHKKRRYLITSQGYYQGNDSIDQNLSPPIVRHSFGSLFGFKTDYVAHRRSMLLICKLCVVSLIMFTVYCMLFFAFKTPESQYFIFHVTIEAILTLFLLCVFFALEIKMTRDIRRMNKQPLTADEEHATKKTLYEPSIYWNYKKMFNDTVTNL